MQMKAAVYELWAREIAVVVSRGSTLRIESIEQIHALIGRAPPAHPLVSVIAASWQEPMWITVPIVGRPVESALYAMSLKRGDECHTEFGRQVHDGQAGSVVVVSPGQTITPLGGRSEDTHDGDGWTVVFEHPQHFARLFRQKTGRSPGEWRRAARAAGA